MSVAEGNFQIFSAVSWGGTPVLTCTTAQNQNPWSYFEFEPDYLADAEPVSVYQREVTGSISGETADLTLIPSIASGVLTVIGAHPMQTGPWYKESDGGIILQTHRPIVGFRFAFPFGGYTRMLTQQLPKYPTPLWLQFEFAEFGGPHTGENATMRVRHEGYSEENYTITYDATYSNMAADLTSDMNSGSIFSSASQQGDDARGFGYDDGHPYVFNFGGSNYPFFRIQISASVGQSPTSNPAEPGWVLNDEI